MRHAWIILGGTDWERARPLDPDEDLGDDDGEGGADVGAGVGAGAQGGASDELANIGAFLGDLGSDAPTHVDRRGGLRPQSSAAAARARAAAIEAAAAHASDERDGRRMVQLGHDP